MQSKLTFKCLVACVLIAGASLPAQAVVVQYTDRNAFLAALSSSSTDNYDDLGGFQGSPLSRAISGYTYNVTADSGVYSDPVAGSQVLSTNAVNEPLTLSFTTGAPTAVGGYFFNYDLTVGVVNGVLTVTANPGASTQSATTASATNFFGWLDDGGTPFTTLVITPPATGNYWGGVDDLILGQAAPASSASVPAPLPLLGTAAAFHVSRRLRSLSRRLRPRSC